MDNHAESKAVACQVWQFNPNLYPLVSSREVRYSTVGIIRYQLAQWSESIVRRSRAGLSASKLTTYWFLNQKAVKRLLLLTCAVTSCRSLFEINHRAIAIPVYVHVVRSR